MFKSTAVMALFVAIVTAYFHPAESCAEGVPNKIAALQAQVADLQKTENSQQMQINALETAVNPPFQAQGLVTAVTPTPSTGACPATVGDSFTGIVHFGESGGTGTTYRISLNTTSSLGVFTEIFPTSVMQGSPSGSYSFGLEGTTLATGTFATTYTPLDGHSLLAVNSLTYTSPIDGTTLCAETDQVTLIR